MTGLHRIPPATLALCALGLLYAGTGLYASLHWSPLGDLAVESDFFAELGPAAQRIAGGQLAVANHPYKGPVQPALVAALHLVLGPLGVGWYRTAVVLSLLAALVMLAGTFRIAATLAGPRAALGALLLAAGNPLVIVQAHKASSDMVFAALAVWTVAVALADGPLPGRRWYAVGLLAAGALLTRYVGGVVVIWAVGWCAWRTARGGRIRALAILAAGLLTLAGPWFAANLLQTGALLTTHNAENVVREFAACAAGPDIVAHYLVNLGARIWQTARIGMGFALVGLGMVGAVSVMLRSTDRRWRALLVWAALYVAALAAVFFRPRFALPLVPVAAVMAGALLLGDRPVLSARTFGPLKERSRAGLGWALVALVILLGYPRLESSLLFYADQQPRHLAGAIAYLRDSAARDGPPPVLMARKAHAAFHAGLPWRHYPTARLTAREFVLAAADREVDLILAGPVEREYGDVAFDLDHLDRLTGVRLAYADSTNRIYRLDRDTPREELGRDPEVLGARRRLVLARAGGDAPAALERARDLARLEREAGELEAAQQTLVAVLADVDLPPGDLLVTRVDLAWTCVLTEDHQTGAAALAGSLDALAAQPDRLLEARGLEYHAIHLAALGDLRRARHLLQRAATLYDAETRPDAGRRARSLLDSLPLAR